MEAVHHPHQDQAGPTRSATLTPVAHTQAENSVIAAGTNWRSGIQAARLPKVLDSRLQGHDGISFVLVTASAVDLKPAFLPVDFCSMHIKVYSRTVQSV